MDEWVLLIWGIGWVTVSIISKSVLMIIFSFVNGLLIKKGEKNEK